MLEVTTSWTIPSGIATKSVMYFTGDEALPAVRAAINAFLTSFRDRLASGVGWSVDATARVLNPLTGTLEGLETDATGQSGTGSGSGLAVPDASQVLIKWGTGQIVNGRFLQGKTYIPGLDANLLSGGDVGNTTRGAIAGAAQTFATGGHGLGVWHRPQGGSGGTIKPATSGTCNGELAVLRRRRNR